MKVYSVGLIGITSADFTILRNGAARTQAPGSDEITMTTGKTGPKIALRTIQPELSFLFPIAQLIPD
jgi:hypothetical protein